VKRLRALFDRWITWPHEASLPGGCPVDAAAREFQHQPGPMRDAVLERQRVLMRELQRTVMMAVETGEFARATDAGQFAFDFMGIVFVHYRAEMLLGAEEARRRARHSFERLVRQYAAS
jgi:hypothetical protein